MEPLTKLYDESRWLLKREWIKTQLDKKVSDTGHAKAVRVGELIYYGMENVRTMLDEKEVLVDNAQKRHPLTMMANKSSDCDKMHYYVIDRNYARVYPSHVSLTLYMFLKYVLELHFGRTAVEDKTKNIIHLVKAVDEVVRVKTMTLGDQLYYRTVKDVCDLFVKKHRQNHILDSTMKKNMMGATALITAALLSPSVAVTQPAPGSGPASTNQRASDAARLTELRVKPQNRPSAIIGNNGIRFTSRSTKNPFKGKNAAQRRRMSQGFLAMNK